MSTDKERLLELLRVREQYNLENRLESFDPYPYQEVFMNDASDRVGLVCSNQTGKCESIQGLIETSKGTKRLYEIWGKDIEVLTYPDAKPKKVLNWIVKPAEECFRVTFNDGRWIESPKGHQILVGSKYLSLSEIFESLPEEVFSLHPSNLALSRLIHALDVRRYLRKAASWMGDCLMGFRQYGEQPLVDEDNVRVYPPLRDDVQQRNSIYAYTGALANKCAYSLLTSLFRLSSLGVGLPILAQFAFSLNRVYAFFELNMKCLLQVFQQSGNSECPSLSFQQAALHQYESLQASSSPLSIDLNQIVSVVPVGTHTLYDMEVEDVHNYLSGGVVNHNSLGATALDAMDLTGLYPDWYDGHRYDRPISMVCGCVNNELTRDILQKFLFGDPTDKELSFGTAWIPKKCLDWKRISLKRGVSDAFLHVMVKHHTDGVEDGWSKVTFSSYESGAMSWMGSSIDIYHGDEEPPLDILAQMGRGCIATAGRIRLTFTPEKGESDVLKKVRRDWSMHSATFADVAGEGCEYTFTDGERLELKPVRTRNGNLGHINKKTIDNLEKDNPPWMLKTRMLGLPMIGEGLVFGFMESEISCDPFEFPDYFKFIDAIDFGGLSTTAHPTAFVRLAYDPQKDVAYIYDGFKIVGAEIPTIAANIIMQKNSDTIPVIWPHDGNKVTGQGETTKDQYLSAGVNMYMGNGENSHFTNPPGAYKREGLGGIQIMPGITEMSTRMSTRRLKVFADVPEFFEEYRKYHMKKGKIVDVDDDFMSAARYALMSIRHAVSLNEEMMMFNRSNNSSSSWMSA